MHRLGLYVLASSFVLGLGCGENNGTGQDAGVDPMLACDSAAATVLTPKLFTDIIQPTCTTNCHKVGGTAEAQGVWDTAANFQAASVGKPSLYSTTLKIVDPTAPANSTAMLKVLGGGTKYRGPKGEPVGGQMPQGLPPLTEDQLKQMRDWICQGAKLQ